MTWAQDTATGRDFRRKTGDAEERMGHAKLNDDAGIEKDEERQTRQLDATVTARTTGKRHDGDTHGDVDGNGRSTASGVRAPQTVTPSHAASDTRRCGKQHKARPKCNSMRILVVVLLGILAILVVLAASVSAGNVVNSGVSDRSAGNGTRGVRGANATVTTIGGTCSDSGNENTNGCDGKSDGTHGYEELSDRQAALLGEVGTGTVLQGIEQGRTFVALFGYASCPDCKAAVPLLLDAAIDNGVRQVLYVDTRANKAWKSNTDIDGYDDLISVMGDRFSTDADGKPHMQVPFVAFVRDGMVVESVEGDDGLSKADSIQADAIGQALIGKYDAGFKAMLGEGTE